MLLRDLAALYEVNASQITRWRKRGLSIHSPRILAAELAQQRSPGSAIHRLIDPQNLNRIETKISQLTTIKEP
jgi:hypothetical protein